MPDSFFIWRFYLIAYQDLIMKFLLLMDDTPFIKVQTKVKVEKIKHNFLSCFSSKSFIEKIIKGNHFNIGFFKIEKNRFCPGGVLKIVSSASRDQKCGKFWQTCLPEVMRNFVLSKGKDFKTRLGFENNALKNDCNTITYHTWRLFIS